MIIINYILGQINYTLIAGFDVGLKIIEMTRLEY